MCLEDTPHTVWWGRERVWVERVTMGSDQRWGCRGRWSPEIPKPRLRVWDLVLGHRAGEGECLVKKGRRWRRRTRAQPPPPQTSPHDRESVPGGLDSPGIKIALDPVQASPQGSRRPEARRPGSQLRGPPRSRYSAPRRPKSPAPRRAQKSRK